MKKELWLKMNLNNIFHFLICLTMILSLSTVVSFAEPVFAEMVDVKINIEQIQALDDLEGAGIDGADFYAMVFIDNFPQSNVGETEEFEDQDIIFPGWEFTHSVDMSRETIPISIFLFDSDWGTRGADDLIDISGNVERELILDLDLTDNCTIMSFPYVSGTCDTEITSSGASENSAEIKFTVKISPTFTSDNSLITCFHSPLLPDSDDEIVIQGKNKGPPFTTLSRTIWVDNAEVPTVRGGGGGFRATVGPFPNGDFSYACESEVRFLGQTSHNTMFSGWKTASVGSNHNTIHPIHALPVSISGPKSSSVDIVFVRNIANYTSINDTEFLRGIEKLMDAFSRPIFLENQNKINFYISSDFGLVKSYDGIGSVDGNNGCDSTLPSNWTDDYPWADIGVIVHNIEEIRDCAHRHPTPYHSNSITKNNFQGTMLHETGHSVFGLADEYCSNRLNSGSSNCDGGYFQVEPHPNLYETFFDCLENSVRGITPCSEFLSERDWEFGDGSWFTSDPVKNDLMVDKGKVQPLDQRRIEYVFDMCESARC